MKKVIVKDNFTEKQNFLNSAINDIAGNLKLIDTKISLLLTTSGVILNALISCRSNIYTVYVISKSQNTLLIIFLFILILYIFTLCLFVFFGIKAITVRKGKSNKSLWFLGDRAFNLDLNAYQDQIINLTKKEIICYLSDELYNINLINSKKLKYARLSFQLFLLYFIITILLFVFVMMFYIWVEVWINAECNGY